MTTIALKIQKEQRYLYLAGMALLILIAVYIYFVSATVMHVVERKETMNKVAQKNSEISKLETIYIAAQHSVSADIATLDGFVVSDKKIFVSRTPDTAALSLVTE